MNKFAYMMGQQAAVGEALPQLIRDHETSMAVEGDPAMQHEWQQLVLPALEKIRSRLRPIDSGQQA